MEDLVQKALSGDKIALETLLTNVQSYIYNVAVRFLWHPADAEDATQEILIKICTNLSKFRGDSKFTTWAYRVAINHLKNTKRSRVEVMSVDFHSFADDLTSGFNPVGYEAADKELLEDEVKVGCTTGMLICLDRDHRLAYILGDIFEMKSVEAGELLEVNAELFRKRLQKARELIRNFMTANCGIANPHNRCRCNNMIHQGINRGIVYPGNLLFTESNLQINKYKLEIEELHNMSGIYKSHPIYKTPGRLVNEIRRILSSGQFQIAN